MPTYLARATAKQVGANQRNALRSTGPRTPEGRAAAARNSTRHGLCARVVPGVNPALPGEDAAAYDAFAAALRRDLKPADEVEEMLAERLAQLAWKLRRVPTAECAAAQQLINAARATHEQTERHLPPRRKTPFVPATPGALIGAEFVGGKSGPFERLQLYEQRIERQFHACLQQLRLLRKMRQENGEESAQSDCSISNRSAALGINVDENDAPIELVPRPSSDESDALPRSSGVSPVDSSPPSFASSIHNKKEGREKKTGETPELREARPTLIPAPLVSDKSSELASNTPSDSPEHSVEQTNEPNFIARRVVNKGCAAGAGRRHG